ncbi:MAG: energy transducer TonB, partial [Candidatus Angelobacter sp.]
MRLYWIPLLQASVVFLAIATTAAQTPQIPNVSQEELASHLITYVSPPYPASARSAEVHGDVVISVEISPGGLVRSSKVLSGPSMLREAAASAVKQWRYSPFHKGQETIAVRGNV